MFDINFRKSLEQALSLQFDKRVQIYDFQSVAGGCINYTVRVNTSIGKLFVKINDPDLYPDMFEKEAQGLELLSQAKAIRVPEVVNYGVADKNAFLVLEYIPSTAQNENFWEDFGDALAKMHQKNTNETFGLDYDNYIGSLKQVNKQYDNWSEFFIEERLNRQIQLAQNNGYIGKAHVRKFKGLFKELKNIFPEEPPALLHGDLWSGNFIVGDDGDACIFDPAVYYGNREAELAFTQLFGGFDERFYEAYNDTYPLQPGFESRKDIYNLYPLMVHVNLFGSGYLPSVESILNNYPVVSS